MFALATCEAARGFDKDQEILDLALKAQGASYELVNWEDEAVDWSKYSMVKLHSTWDYQDCIEKFRAWLITTATKTKLANNLETVLWNVDKRYLRELQDNGLQVLPTVFLETESELDSLALLLQEEGECSSTSILAGDLIVKPAISAGSNNTERFTNDAAGAIAHARMILTKGNAKSKSKSCEDGEGAGMTVLLQPYSPTIDTCGEIALCYLSGKYSHSLRKSPVFKASAVLEDNGLYRDSEIVLNDANVTAVERAFGEKVMQFLIRKFTVPPLYCRVDVVMNTNGVPEIMEVELTEPSFFLYLDPSGAAAARSAAAFVKAAASCSTE